MPARFVQLATSEDVDAVQRIFNHSENSAGLGGFTLREAIAQKIQAGQVLVVMELRIATLDKSVVVGASEVGYDGKHRMKMQLVGVDPEKKRQRVATALYTGWALVAALRGRLHMQDHIIGDNPHMPGHLTKLGFSRDVVLRSKVRRHKDLCLWVKHLYDAGLTDFYRRVPPRYQFDIEDTEKYRSNFIDTYTMLVQMGRNADAHFLRVTREEALEYLQLQSNRLLREELYTSRMPQTLVERSITPVVGVHHTCILGSGVSLVEECRACNPVEEHDVYG